MKWKYKTYNNRTPESCPRVFFCCNKTDFNKYFDEIAGDILKYQPNAAIFYYEHEEEPEQDENYLFDLSGMQLFVVPVTTDFFLEEGFARQLELPFAMEHHIPVLPLIQENGLESLVNESFGNIQCINKSALLGDVTAVPYAQKMKQFLNEVLIGDELDKRIRAEFSKSIFLSYRKKDRKYAQKIMSSIHDCPGCWDVEIWYDEFLVPGENFNNTIRDKITKSNLFTMVVTPNLLEKPNYVMEMEYPMAQELRLEILPVEALTTNRDILEQFYENIHPCIALENKQELEKYIASRFVNSVEDSTNIKEISSVHYYLIGLAYHSGINMEVDYGKGIALMLKASQMGLPEADKKLASVYKNGDGVTVDYQKAIHYQQQYCELLEKEMDSEAVLNECIAAYGELAELNRISGETKIACKIFEKMLACIKKLDTETVNDSRMQLLARTYYDLGKLYAANSNSDNQEQIDKAFEYSEKAVDIQRKLLEKEWTTERALQLVESLGFYGRLCFGIARENQVDDVKAKRLWQEGFELIKALLDKNEDLEALEYYRIAVKLADDMSETGIGSKATCWGLALLGEGTNLITNYACAAKWIAGINPDRATSYYEEGIAYAMRCIENDESQSIVMRMNLMFFYFQFAEIYRYMPDGKNRERECYSAGYELAAELCEKIKSEKFDGIKDYFFSMLDEREHYIVGSSEYELTIENSLFKS